MDQDQKWSLFKARIQQKLPEEDYEGWLASLQLVSLSAERVIFAGISHPIFREDLKRNHLSLLKELLRELYPEHGTFSRTRFEFNIGEYTNLRTDPVQTEFFFENKELNSSFSRLSSHSTSKSRSRLTEELPDDKKVVQLEDYSVFNPKFNFDNFIVGENNRFATEAGLHIVQSLGQYYNPLLLIGDSGVGKTHLLQAIGQQIQATHPTLKVIYIRVETFLNEFLSHLQRKKMPAFRQRYRKADVLIIDDLSEITNSPACQEELCHTFKALIQNGKQVLVTSLYPPNKFKNLHPSLATLLDAGLMVSLNQPNVEEKKKIILEKSRQNGMHISPEIIHFIASHIHTLPKIVGALIHLGAKASLMNQKITLPFATETLLRHLDRKLDTGKTFSIDQIDEIFQKVSTLFHVSVEDLQSTKRDKTTAKARQATIYLLKELTNLSLNDIGKKLGNRSHSVVLHNYTKMQQILLHDPMLHQQLHSIKEAFQPSTNNKTETDAEIFSLQSKKEGRSL